MEAAAGGAEPAGGCAGAPEEPVVSLADVLAENEELEKEARAVLGGSDHERCSYSQGPFLCSFSLPRIVCRLIVGPHNIQFKSLPHQTKCSRRQLLCDGHWWETKLGPLPALWVEDLVSTAFCLALNSLNP
uniref:Uncharacterized protein n=1 Tax=Terrapene triunguis TaxID=2587831 RepID=A0A674K1Q8_9SAUR